MENVRIRRYFSKPTRVREHKYVGNTGLNNVNFPFIEVLMRGIMYNNNNNNNNNIYLLQLSCYPVRVVILHVNKT